MESNFECQWQPFFFFFFFCNTASQTKHLFRIILPLDRQSHISDPGAWTMMNSGNWQGRNWARAEVSCGSSGFVSGPSASLPGNPKALWQHLPDSSTARFYFRWKTFAQGRKKPIFFNAANYFVLLFSIFVTPTTIFLFFKKHTSINKFPKLFEVAKVNVSNAQDVLTSLSVQILEWK